MTIRFDGRVAIVTGAGAGLGRSHALALAARGARVVVNDFGGDVHGTGGSSEPAERVAEEIRRAGGEAISHGADVANPGQVADMVARALDRWKRIDVLINNAGILRDASFAKGTLADFRTVVDVHLIGVGRLQPGRVAAHAQRRLRPHPDDHLDVGHLRQLRPGQLRRGQDRA